MAGVIARHALSAVGAWLVSRGILDESAIEPVIGAVLTIGAVVWSVIQKQRVVK